MTAAMRSNVVSSFTIIKGALIPETYSTFRHWDFALSAAANLLELKRTNHIGAKSANWLRDVVFVIQRRFDPENRDKTLVKLAVEGCDVESWKPLMLWHMTRDEFLVRDFLINWLYTKYKDAAQRLGTNDVVSYLCSLSTKNVEVASRWSDSTSKRVAAGLLKIAADFGLVRGTVAREFSTYHLCEESFIYLLHAMMDELQNAVKVIACPDWRMFLMSPYDVEAELLRLHQFRKLHYQSAGSIVQLELPCESAAEYAKRLVA
ncbi:MAG: DUF1819 family protein [Phycisphaerales bacterium]|nr:DUF1819 family protein [Phycisphaerales bacterium]